MSPVRKKSSARCELREHQPLRLRLGLSFLLTIYRVRCPLRGSAHILLLQVKVQNIPQVMRGVENRRMEHLMFMGIHYFNGRTIGLLGEGIVLEKKKECFRYLENKNSRRRAFFACQSGGENLGAILRRLSRLSLNFPSR